MRINNLNQGDKLVFTWWNTALSPSAKPRAKDEDREFACYVISHLVSVKKSSFIALGEISIEDFEYFEKACSIEGYEYELGVSRVGRGTFDTCYLYDASKIEITDIFDITRNEAGSLNRIAQQVDLLVLSERALAQFHLFVSHWPSRISTDGDGDRCVYGVRLRDCIPDSPYIIFLGDYNDEPFNNSLSSRSGLMATRDLKLALKRKNLFYNPFWKCLSQTNWDSGCFGSYFYRQGKITRWHTFDQIIFSRAFLLGKKWRLTLDFEHIVEVPYLVDAVMDRKKIFDHIPVSAQVEEVC
jgi:hypothetical protein